MRTTTFHKLLVSDLKSSMCCRRNVWHGRSYSQNKCQARKFCMFFDQFCRFYVFLSWTRKTCIWNFNFFKFFFRLVDEIEIAFRLKFWKELCCFLFEESIDIRIKRHKKFRFQFFTVKLVKCFEQISYYRLKFKINPSYTFSLKNA